MACIEGIGGGPVRHTACSWARLPAVYRLRFNGSSKNGFGPDPMRDRAKAMPDPAKREGRLDIGDPSVCGIRGRFKPDCPACQSGNRVITRSLKCPEREETPVSRF
ncbi:MAG: hypothetical protein C6P37_15145 [Caldibacillus debilis]|uniref:Uncharacterized protein n=1 Tax=Caldibacillus debilis TaxID=301148 RepID=A0A3E0JXY4_9BACI|nr:MAG: hypothetical protein C6P37_15145 [Caldibacillus debilis]